MLNYKQNKPNDKSKSPALKWYQWKCPCNNCIHLRGEKKSFSVSKDATVCSHPCNRYKSWEAQAPK